MKKIWKKSSKNEFNGKLLKSYSDNPSYIFENKCNYISIQNCDRARSAQTRFSNSALQYVLVPSWYVPPTGKSLAYLGLIPSL